MCSRLHKLHINDQDSFECEAEDWSKVFDGVDTPLVANYLKLAGRAMHSNYLGMVCFSLLLSF